MSAQTERDLKNSFVGMLMNFTAAAVGWTGYALNEKMQEMAMEKIIPYSTYMGYASDIAGPFSVTSGLMMILEMSSRKTKAVAATTLASALTAYELYATPNNSPPTSCTYDIKDIICYWGATFAAFALSEYARSGKLEDHAAKAKTAFKRLIGQLLEDTVLEKT